MAPPLAARSLFLASVLGWLVPGLGQAYVGRPGRGLCMGLAIVLLYLGGLALSGFTAVNPRTYELEFVAHALIGGPTALVLQLGPADATGLLLPHLEVARLYCAVAGLLNLVAVCDALGEILAAREEEAERYAMPGEGAAAAPPGEARVAADADPRRAGETPLALPFPLGPGPAEGSA